MDIVAGNTRDIRVLVRTAKPAYLGVLLMAAQAGPVLLGNGSMITITKGTHHRHFRLLPGLHVFL